MNLHQEKMNDVIQLSLTEGADQAELIYKTNNELKMQPKDQKLDLYSIAETQSYSCRLIKNNQSVQFQFEVYELNSIKSMIQASLKGLDYSDNKNPHLEINTTNKINDCKDDISSELINNDLKEKIKMTLALEESIKKLKKDKPLLAPYVGFNQKYSHLQYSNHLDAFCEYNSHYCSYWTSALLQGPKSSSLYINDAILRKFQTQNFDSFSQKATQHATALLSGSPIKTDKYDVIFDVKCLASIFSTFSNAFSALAVKNKTSLFKWGELETTIFDSRLNLVDYSLNQHGFDSPTFDDEGQISQDLNVIQNGKLNTFLHNNETSSFFKTSNNNRASRSGSGPIQCSFKNISLESSEINLKDLKQGQYLKIIDLDGVRPGSNLITGDFSYGARGYLMENDNIIQAVNNITISGNFKKLFNKISAIGNQQVNSTKSFSAPEIRFSQLNIAGT